VGRQREACHAPAVSSASPARTPARTERPLGLEASYASLPEPFYARVAPTPVAAPGLLRVNRPLARELGLDPDFLASEEGVAILAGNRLPPDAEPLAMAYAGHQFGQFVPSLGDGRAVLLGEVVDRSGVRRDIHLKGAGRTPFSRMGDGRAGLGPVLREYVVSEAMAALGIPTTRALAMVSTGELVPRPQRVEPGAVLARVARSHVRVGTFEYFARRGDEVAVRRLADYVIARLHPDAAEAAEPYRALLDEVVRRQAALIAHWMGVGFIHGVMNTDNVSIAGETIDYGPCAFLDGYHPATVYSSIDHGGRYAYGRQPAVGQWNLARFAETLLPLLGEPEGPGLDAARESLAAYPDRFATAYQTTMRRKLGLAEARDGDDELAQDLLERMAGQRADFTLTFRRLSELPAGGARAEASLRALFTEQDALEPWLGRWRARLAAEGGDPDARTRAMRSANPAFIPRNHRVEQAIAAAVADRDLGPLEDLLAVATRPYEDPPAGRSDLEELARPPEPHEQVRETFCGT